MASSRKVCSTCKKNFSKSAFYLHLPCSLSNESAPSEKDTYVFCEHCNQRVARPTYYEHQRNSTCATSCNSREDGASMEIGEVSGLEFSENEVIFQNCNEDYLEIQEGFDEEDQVFFSDESEGDNDDVSEDMSNVNLNNASQDREEDEESEKVISDGDDIDNMNDQSAGQSVLSSESKVLLMFIFLWQTMYKVSDNGIAVLLNFFKRFLTLLGTLAKIDTLVNFAKSIPSTLYMATMAFGFGQDEFEKYVVCPKCMAIYEFDKCTTRRSNGKVVSKKCTDVRYPNHPQKRRRVECGTLLMKKVRSKSGSLYLSPKRVYCFKPLISSLKSLLSRPGFAENCEQWRNRNIEEDKMEDVYEGKIWKEFLDSDGKNFFSKIGNLGVMLNVDWFQPYKHTKYSCGVIYSVIMNLPREERFKLENVIVVGIIPGPHEPKGNINTFLQPLVNELTDLWDGVIFDERNIPGKMRKIKVALLAICCDIPAARKCGGFAGHSATKGCSRCLKSFLRDGFGSKPDFSGFDKEHWEKRTNETHRVNAEETLTANCPTRFKALVRNTGAKYTVLLQLPYYDAIRFVVIDPMHNLFLGIAKHTLKVWMEEGLLNEKDFQILQKRVNAVEPPPEIGRIPSKIATGFGGFTADQWKNWVCYYSVFALKGILPSRHYAVWTHFVDACRLICCRTITPQQCVLVETKLVDFCKAFEEMYGKEKCTPNMHLSCHLSECLEDYGPVYSFWCFSFERYNGILGSFQKGSLSIEIQLMRKFLRNSQLQQMEWPEEYQSFGDLLVTTVAGTVGEVSIPNERNNRDKTQDDIVRFSPIKRVGIDNHDAARIAEVYQLMFPNHLVDNVLRISEAFSRIKIKQRVIRSVANTGVIVRSLDSEPRPAEVKRFLTNDVIISKAGKKKKVTNILAEVMVWKPHPERNFYPAPFEVWSTDLESVCYVPITHISGQFISVKYKVKFRHGLEKVQVIIPLIGRFC